MKKIKPNPIYEYAPVFCKLDGKLLIDGRHVRSKEFSERTGEPIEIVQYLRYCADWQSETSKHTIWWSYTTVTTVIEEV